MTSTTERAGGGVPLWPSKRAFASVSTWAIPGYLASLVLVHFLRASRWRFLIAPVKRVPYSEVLLLNWIGPTIEQLRLLFV